MKKGALTAGVSAMVASLLTVSAPAQARQPFLGEIMQFGGNFCPRGWARTDGKLLPIRSNTALFSILGTTYGGDGRTTFGLPDFRGRVAMGPGRGPGLTEYRLGQRGGQERVTSVIARVEENGANANSSVARGGRPEENRQPYLTITTCIAVQGIFPSRN